MKKGEYYNYKKLDYYIKKYKNSLKKRKKNLFNIKIAVIKFDSNYFNLINDDNLKFFNDSFDLRNK